MNKNKIFIPLLAIGALMALGACTPTSSSSSSATSSQNQESSSPVSQEHVHSWKTSWEKDETHHWHECQDESCEVVDSKATHSWGEGSITKPATEEAEGEKTYTCSVCEATKVEKVDKLVHTHAYTVEKVDAEYLVSQATCENAAVYNKSCACGEKGTETFTYGDPLDHTWSEWTTKTPATCTEKEVEHRTCTVSGCNVEETRDGDAALNHNMVTKYDTTHHWTECDNEGCDEATEKTTHTWDQGVVTKEATEQEEGVRTHTCTSCPETKDESIAKLSHTHSVSDQWVSDGSQHWKACSGCSEKVDLANHNVVTITGEPATCLAPGKEDGKQCDICKKVLLEQATIEQLDHSYTGDYVDNEDGTHSQKCINGCDGKSEGVAHVHSTLEVVTQSVTGGEFAIKCACGNTHSLTINGQTDCDTDLVETSDKLVLRATLKESVISNLQNELPTVHADVIAQLEAWYLDIAPTEQLGFEKYIVYVGGKEATVEEQEPGSNNYQFKVAIHKDETMKIYKEGTPITIGETTDTAYTATSDGVYTIYVNTSDKIYVDPSVLGIPYSAYSLKVNDLSASSENVASSTEYAKFVITLEANDVLVVLGDTVELLSYTAKKAGEHTVVVDKYNVVTVTDPDVVMQTITFHYYNSDGWTSVNLYAWTDAGANFTGGWPGAALTEESDNWWTITIEAESFDGLKIIFNGSGGQTADITYIEGLDYYYGKSSTGYSSAEEAKAASEVVVTYDYYLRGSMNNWTGSEAYGLTKSGDEYVITIELEAGAEFKIVADATAWNKGDWGYSNVESGCASLVSNNNGNIKVNSAGTYTIYFKPNSNSMWIAKA